MSLYVHSGGRAERELACTDYDAFYGALAHGGSLPSTSQPSIGDFVAAYEPLLEHGSDVVSIHLSGGLSGTPEAARQAKAMLEEQGAPGRIEVLDSQSACGGSAAWCWRRLRRRAAAATRQAVLERAERRAQAMRLWFCLDTLEYLQRGGRIGRAAAWIGGALQIKPILSVESEITPVERVRTAGRGFERMVEYMRELRESGSDAWVVQHVQAPERAAALADRGRELFGSEPVWVSEIGPVIGTYTGPGLLGVGGLPASLLAGL